MESSQKNLNPPKQETKLCKHCKMEIPQNAKVCPYCRKRQGGGLKWWILGIIVLIVLIAAAGGAFKSDNNSEQSTTSRVEAEAEPAQSSAQQNATEQSSGEAVTAVEPTTEPTAAPTAEPEPTPEPKPEQTRYESGMYLVGTDMPAGEYVLFADGFLGYMEVDSDSSGDFSSILCNDNFSYNTIVTVSEGNYLSISGAYAVPFEEAELDTSGNGMFKVGAHIPAGEYKVVVDEDSAIGLGYLEVATDSSHDFASIRTNDNIESSTYITVNEGEYLTLDGCHIEP